MPSDDEGSDRSITVAVVCVENAGRSQMAAGFAERAIEDRGVGDHVRALSGGTDLADAVHDVVVEVIQEAEFDFAHRTPHELSRDELLDGVVANWIEE